MVPYSFDNKPDDYKKKVVVDFYDKNMGKRDLKDVEAINNWCIQNLGDIGGKIYTYKDVVCATPKEIDVIADYCNRKAYNKKIPQLQIVVNKLYKYMRAEAQKCLYDALGAKVCPYCNRNYVYVDKRNRACDFDHLYAKSNYPLLAASFYNLIPACAVCNRKKNNKILAFNPHHKYKYDELPYFRIWIKKVDYLENPESIDIEMDGKGVFDSDIENLQLNALYSSHRDVVRDVMICKMVYSEQYVEELLKNFKSVSLTQNELRNVLFSIPESPEEFEERPLSKLRYEVWNAMEI